MSVDGSAERRKQPTQTQTPSTGNGNCGISSMSLANRLRLNPNKEHKPDSYDDLHQLEFSPLLFSSLERYLPPTMLNGSRDLKLQYMRDILLRYSSESERTRVRKWFNDIENTGRRSSHTISLYTRSYTLCRLHSSLSPHFSKQSMRIQRIALEVLWLNPLLEFIHLKCFSRTSVNCYYPRWVIETNFRIMRPNTMNRYGCVLDDFGLETMLDKVMEDFIRPMSRVFFPEVGGSTLDSHHGFVVEYGTDKDAELGFHVDDSEVTLNVCLGKQFSGGELFFRGIRCDKHVNSETQSEEIFDYSHVPGHAVLHRGRHRHGARATTSGCRVNLLLWCRSSVFRELKKYQKDSSNWCGECQREKKERRRQSIAATKLELLKRDGKPTS
ncbi:PREDICTED: uncharacterized PKHD-type hydroxylase At1g22950-like isoform X2 [Prunus mume]|uniref:Uncharacterized PKHD-type hydroxylase At1g22950-like isoform X2 n=1 Tax=Prunus mume TaxID=102107 RepID=A0ABM0PRC5_PRUMU|nr:PREDICTED: uncharacterized PKHD-type hydroxylase At1g22950-like isoform X2 [Prunus mume]